MEAQELVAEEAAGKPHAVWPMRCVSREVGENDVGIVAWQLTLKTPECPQGRQVRTLSPESPGSKSCVPERVPDASPDV